jgi:hypothetical protein
MKVDRDINIGGERFALLVETQHGKITARTAVHAQGFRRRIGGARFVRDGDVAEVGHLASGMTWKCAAAGLPADGEKSVITCPDGIPESIEERAAVLSEHARQVRDVDAGVIFGPDMNNGEDVMSLASEADDLRDHITGLDPASRSTRAATPRSDSSRRRVPLVDSGASLFTPPPSRASAPSVPTLPGSSTKRALPYVLPARARAR